MRKQTKLVAVLSAAALLAMGASMTSFAAGWEKDDAGVWHYYDSDDEMVTDEWKKDGGKWFRRRAICTAVSVSCGTSERGIRLPEAGAHGKGALRVLSPVYRALQAEKR